VLYYFPQLVNNLASIQIFGWSEGLGNK